jgi:hypothetical protein
MGNKEFIEAVKKVVEENAPIPESVQEEILSILKAASSIQPKKYELDELDMRILKEDENLLRRLAK